MIRQKKRRNKDNKTREFFKDRIKVDQDQGNHQQLINTNHQY